MSVANNLPYRAEYAKSGRAACKGCKTPIEKGALRLAIMTKSRFHDGKDANWHHVDCFFAKGQPKSVGDIEHFEALRYEDQEMIKKKVGADGAKPSGSDMKKKTKEDFSVEYAKSGKSTCVACEQSIKKDLVRIGKKEYLSERAMMHGPYFKWHHVDCFVKTRSEVEIGFYDAGKNLPGYKDLDEDDMKLIVSKLPAIAAGKRKLEEDKPSGSGDGKRSKLSKDNSSSAEEEAIKAQNKQMYKYRDILEQNMKRKDLSRLLSRNNQEIPIGDGVMMDRLSDIMTFGALVACETCKNGQFVYRSGVGYQCLGDITEFTKCAAVVDEPKRVPFKLPSDYKDVPGLENYKCKVSKRIIPKHAAPVDALKVESKASGVKVNSKPLEKFKIGIDDGFSKSEITKMTSTIESFGGKITSRPSEKVAFFISTSKNVDKMPSKIKKAKELGIPVVSKSFVESITEVKYNLAESVKCNLLSDWVDDIRGRLLTLNEGYEKIPEKRRNNMLELEMPANKKLIMKNGAIVEPESQLDEIGHVLKMPGKSGYYNAVLNYVDIEADKNSFYKIQVIESDNKPYKYWTYRAWGRIGTKIGGQKIDEDLNQSEAIELFEHHFMEQTGNVWGQEFKKKPKKYISLEIDYSDKDTVNKIVPSKSNSSLPLTIQELVCLIFDVDKMKQTMIEFEIDMEKMPLGKMSRQQILNAYSALNKAMERIGAKVTKADRVLVDASTRFFSFIPHNFGIGTIPVLDTDAAIKSKIEMLDNLLEIELAYELLKDGGDSGDGTSVDKFYKKLHTSIEILEGNSEEYKVIQKYLDNTHAATHDSYKLHIDQIFKIDRKDEKKRYQAFKDLHNRKLLWHGSRTTNYVGILSQGLRIAPPEAPVTGYMFGKGIYFADMVSKSANYCYTSPGNTTGLMMLCEVALGDMHERTKAKETLTKAPEKTHSVKGCGSTHPDPKDSYTFPNGVEVPYGKPVSTKKGTSLMYNEYIVYDVAQVNIRYLLKVDFKYKGRR